MPDALLESLARGQKALEEGRVTDAIVAFSEAQRLAPDELGVALALANAHRLQGDVVTTREVLIAAQRRRPITDAALGMQLGSALLDAGAPREAAACFTRVIRMQPTDPAPRAALAGAKRTAGDPATAWSHIEVALGQSPDHPAFLLTAAQIRHDLGDVHGARAWLTRAESVRPGHAATQLQRAYTELLSGASHAGWSAFETRPLPLPATRARPWHGESLQGASIVVTAEQGVGDQFQFVRFVSALVDRGAAQVVVECHADALTLLAGSGLTVVARGNAPETDWHVPMLSLPYRLQVDGDVFGHRVPYLHVLEAPSGPAGPTMPLKNEALQIGVVWAGNPAFSGRVTRDLDPSLLPHLLDCPGVEWISLQHGEAGALAGRGALERLTPIHLPADWASTASILSRLDGLVTTDTGIAHLAGALGIRTWVMLQHVPDWRWGLTGASTPWYPTLQLLRQPRHGDWHDVVAQLHRALRDATHVGHT